MARFLTPARLIAAGFVLLAVAAVLYVAPSDKYIFLPDRARAVAPLVDVQGEHPDQNGGGIYYVAVDVRKATILEQLIPGLREGATLVDATQVRAPGENEQQHRRAELASMQQSQQYAAAVALRSLGYRIQIVPRGALIESTVKGFPAAGKLRPKDLVVAVNGQAVRSPDEFRAFVGRRRPGEIVRLLVKGGGRTRTVVVRTTKNPDRPKRPFIGVLIDEPGVKLPVPVRINTGQVGGPSAGLAFALDVLEELGRDVDRGNKVVATGELRLDGSVGAVGGIKQKTIGARRAGADVFLVPGDNEREARRHAGNLRVIAVNSFRQALRSLATLESRPQKT
ncbi:MAG: PDZ domain-containing protein [Actinobacteria bacterium]|nr:PDZ domain-containing protein [Actinomycetota bacterium]